MAQYIIKYTYFDHDGQQTNTNVFPRFYNTIGHARQAVQELGYQKAKKKDLFFVRHGEMVAGSAQISAV